MASGQNCYDRAIELEGQEMVFLNGGPAHQLNPAFSFFVRCDSQKEIDNYWDKLIEGGNPWHAAGSQIASACAGRLCDTISAS